MKNILISIFLLVINQFTMGQGSGWVVTPSDFSNSGEVNAIVVMNSVELSTGELGAFAGSICRGRVTGKFFPPTGKTIFSLICYSNVANSEILTFKYYDPVQNKEYEITEKFEFKLDMVIGSAMTPTTLNISAENQAPQLENPLPDIELSEGLGVSNVNLAGVFSDADDDILTYSAISSALEVATVTVSGAILTLHKQGIGSTNITVTANDGNGGTVNDIFNVDIISGENGSGWVVTPSDFSNSGEVNAIVIMNSVELSTGELGAFAGSECRGLVTGKIFPPTGKTIFSLICYSNVASGEILTFKYYDPGENKEYEITEMIPFTADMVVGSAMTPTILTINQDPCVPPAVPIIGTITQPTCETATGSVILNSLPAIGTWTLTRTPGGITTTGTGTSKTITGLASGTYTYTVTNAAGCTSGASANVVIDAVPAAPEAPMIGPITQPTCETATGSVILNGLPATDTWTLTRTPGGITTTGTGTNKTVTGLSSGTYTYTVTNAAGCTSGASANVVIDAVPVAPEAPKIGPITQPSCTEATGSVFLYGLPATGTWTLTRTPGGITTTGTGTNKTVTGLSSGTYTYTVTNAAGCTSGASSNVVIDAQPAAPEVPMIGPITQPTCSTATGSVFLYGLPATGTWTLTRTPGGETTNGSGTGLTVTGLSSGTYKYTVTNAAGCTSSESDIIDIKTPVIPLAPKISLNDNILHSDAAIGNQWYNYDGKINGATSQTYTPISSDDYYVIVSISGCSSPMSNVISFKLTGVELIENIKKIKVYPNPTFGNITIEGLTENEKTEIALYNINSKLVKVQTLHSSLTQIDISDVISGVYLLVINNRFEQAVKIIKK